MEEGKKKIMLQAILFVVVFAVAFLGTRYIMSHFNTTESKVEKVSKK